MNSRTITYIIIASGAILGIYADAYSDDDQVLLVLAIAILMFGLYRLARGISSRKDQDNFIKTEEKETDEPG